MSSQKNTAKPSYVDDHDEGDDLDDLDDVLDQFKPSAAASSSSSSAAAAATQKAQGSTAQGTVASSADDEGTPQGSAAPTNASSAGNKINDEDGLDEGFDDALAQQFAKELAKGMEEMFGPAAAQGQGQGAMPGLGQGGTGAAGDDPFANMSQEEMMKQFESIMAEMSMGEAGAAASGSTAKAAGGLESGSSASRGAAAGASGDQPTAANYQDAIRSTMSRLRQSETSGSSSAGGSNPFGDFSDEDMAKLLQGLGGGSGEGGMPDSEEGMAKMLETMMGELMSKEVLYEPLKELRDKYPPYLASPPSSTTAEDLERYKAQHRCVSSVVAIFENPKFENGTEAEKKSLKDQIGELMNEMQDSGAPPQEVVGEMPEGLEGLPGFGGGAGAGGGAGGGASGEEECVVM